jgi:hypothetical protein
MATIAYPLRKEKPHSAGKATPLGKFTANANKLITASDRARRRVTTQNKTELLGGEYGAIFAT